MLYLQLLNPPNTQIAVGDNAEAKRAIRDAFLCHPKLVEWGWQPPTAVGSGEKTIALFQVLFAQRSSGSRSRVTTTLLQCMDDFVRWRQAGDQDGGGKANLVIIVAATNTPWLVDRAFLRPGRLDRTIHVRLPDETERKHILQIQMRSMKAKFNTESSVNEFCTQLAKNMEHFSGADCGSLCRAAAVRCLIENRTFVREENFLGVLERGEVQPSTSESLLQQITARFLR